MNNKEMNTYLKLAGLLVGLGIVMSISAALFHMLVWPFVIVGGVFGSYHYLLMTGQFEAVEARLTAENKELNND